MPQRPLRVCGKSGCATLVSGSPHCPAHTTAPTRGSSTKQGYGSQWRKARSEYLKQHPHCECKEHKGKADAPPSTCIDHITPHRGNKELFWNRRNWCAMAKRCHDAKTSSEDGGFGNPRKAGVTPISGPVTSTEAKAVGDGLGVASSAVPAEGYWLI